MAITGSTPYDPVYHSNIPRNFRFQWKARTDRELTLSDAEIFNVWRDYYSVEPDVGQTDDELVLEVLGELLDEKENPA